MLLGFLVGALIYPVAGNWIWGGGWLANLGSNLRLAHGFVDPLAPAWSTCWARR